MNVNALLEKIANDEKSFQDSLEAKLKAGGYLSDEEIARYKLNDNDEKIAELADRIFNGEKIQGFNFNDFLGTPQAKVLIPKILIGTMKKAADPLYLASSFYKKVRFKTGQALMFPEFGVMRAHDVAEGQEINGVSVA